MAYDHLMEKLDQELTDLDKKVAQGHDLDEKEYMCAKTWAKTLVSLKTNDAMDEEYGEEEYEASYRGQRRDSMGRYSREGRNEGSYRRSMYSYPMYPSYRGGSRRGTRNGYSYHDGNEDDPMMKLQEAYDNAASEQERKTIRKLMEQMEG